MDYRTDFAYDYPQSADTEPRLDCEPRHYIFTSIRWTTTATSSDQQFNSTTSDAALRRHSPVGRFYDDLQRAYKTER